jgi:heme/copper-type cytochrome/quinol oxidase subunit 2
MEKIATWIIRVIIVFIAFVSNRINNRLENIESKVEKNTIEIEVLKEKLELYKYGIQETNKKRYF